MKHVDQVFPQGGGGVDVEGAAQSDDGAAAGRSRSRMTEGTVGADRRLATGGAQHGLSSLVTTGAGKAVTWVARTGMRLSCGAAALGTRISSTPSRTEASVLSAST